MVNELIIHLGDRKTGSTAIQETLIAAKAHLPEPHCFFYPSRFNDIGLANSFYARSEKVHLKKRFKKLAAAMRSSDAQYGIISAESFEGVNPRDLKNALKKYLPEHAETARCIAYVRPHADRFLSNYAELIKIGEFLQPPAAYFERIQASPIWRYSARFEAWQSVFGDQFTLRPFIRSHLKNEDVVDDFFDVIMSDPSFAKSLRKVSNESLDLESTLLVRKFHRQAGGRIKSGAVRHPIGREVVRRLGMIDSKPSSKLELNRRFARDLHGEFLDDAKALDAAFFNDGLFVHKLENSLAKAKQHPILSNLSSLLSEPTIQSVERAYSHFLGQVGTNFNMLSSAIGDARFDRLTGKKGSLPDEYEELFSRFSTIEFHGATND